MDTLKIGMIGLDTSHCEAFIKILNDKQNPHHIPGANVHIAYAGGSPDFEISISRVAAITAAFRDDYQVTIADSPEQVAEHSDAIIMTAVDGRVHYELFEKIARYRKPVYIGKPLAVSAAHAQAMSALAREHGTPLMSASAIRCSDHLSGLLKGEEHGAVIGADCYGPMHLEETQPGLFWYGIHTVDSLYRIMGKGCVQVTATTNEDYEFVVGEWPDGRIGTVRGNRKGSNNFGATVHKAARTESVILNVQARPIYASLLEEMIAFFRSGRSGISLEEAVEVIRFIEASNESRATGKTVRL